MNRSHRLTIEYGSAGYYGTELWSPVMSKSVNSQQLQIYVDAQKIDAKVYMNEYMDLMVEMERLTECFDCAQSFYNGNEVVLQKKDTVLSFKLDEPEAYYLNGQRIETASAIEKSQDTIFLSSNVLVEQFGYEAYWDVQTTTMDLYSIWEGTKLPSRYDLREHGRNTAIKNQGKYGTCWAVASISALETSLRPEEEKLFAAEHMAFRNSFTKDIDEGGEYTMAMAYLLGWQGPVPEDEDPYGDMKSPEYLQAVKHVQEVQIINQKNIEKIKEAVFKYGAVQSSIYTSLKNASSKSTYYNRKDYAYCYIGDDQPNHEIIIIGWDDAYPKENFTLDVAGDGAFICQNSWGKKFGDDGVFYISYFDSNIGSQSVVYTRVEETDNYDYLYQTDLCGWIGLIGYGKETAWFANLFTAERKEQVEAVGFYATGEDTMYEMYLVDSYSGKASLTGGRLIASGSFENAGFYTVDLSEPFEVITGQEYAIVIKIKTPGAVHPIAAEYYVKGKAEDVYLEDGNGYISSNGIGWSDVEDEYNCNVCMKVYTSDVE